MATSTSGPSREPIQCVICLEEIINNLVATPCSPVNHLFHRACIEHWLPGHYNCPFCRQPVYQQNLQDRKIERIPSPLTPTPKAEGAMSSKTDPTDKKPELTKFQEAIKIVFVVTGVLLSIFLFSRILVRASLAYRHIIPIKG